MNTLANLFAVVCVVLFALSFVGNCLLVKEYVYHSIKQTLNK
jgi:hypothetical protein